MRLLAVALLVLWGVAMGRPADKGVPRPEITEEGQQPRELMPFTSWRAYEGCFCGCPGFGIKANEALEARCEAAGISRDSVEAYRRLPLPAELDQNPFEPPPAGVRNPLPDQSRP
ncbi:unnamed protein product [Vitrella brassicaformis CCMP3155]|uniref:Uncharacterized protein n=2 Tax=Vitrella brassicaformis TaxID=1169539 RepID=A0A0G4H3C4_VITBC|nr:unnamed protein product [Vitrella brassicaformis CCMP3155]|mmetsp:Transcript_24530/g.60633  ORF Transcript_24530/g.60633 Transcript_24530/m.60633 type:complete len:115 (+) Transcript_24530:141-485(+)|eukprot:CEM38100.1 unnamed protein product [Vitrella brassicaformis CCMP3155]